MALISYADQEIAAQVARLKNAGCETVYSDVLSGARASRPQWDACLKGLRGGDQLVITKLDSAGRSLKHLMELSDHLDERGITLNVIDQSIDTSTSAGRALFQMLGVFAEFERNLISERTKEHYAVARGEDPADAHAHSPAHDSNVPKTCTTAKI